MVPIKGRVNNKEFYERNIWKAAHQVLARVTSTVRRIAKISPRCLSTGAEERDLGAGGAVESAAVGRRDGNQLEINIVFELVPRCVSLSVS